MYTLLSKLYVLNTKPLNKTVIVLFQYCQMIEKKYDRLLKTRAILIFFCSIETKK